MRLICDRTDLIELTSDFPHYVGSKSDCSSISRGRYVRKMSGKGRGLADLQEKYNEAAKVQKEKEDNLEAAKEVSQPIRRERAYVLTENQQIRTNIEVLKKTKRELELKIKLKEREAEEIAEKTRTEIQVHKQKVKHLLHTHANDLHKIEEDHAAVQKAQLTEHNDALKRYEAEAMHLTDDFLNNQGSHAIQVKQQKDDAKSLNARFAEQYAKQFAEIEKKQEENMEALYEDYNLQRINELHEIQERKDHHINRLIKNHKKAFQDMRKFFNKITQDHLTSIAQYDAEFNAIVARLHDYEQRKKAYDKDIAELNRQLAIKREENGNLHKILSTYESDKMALANSRAMIQSLIGEIDSLQHQRNIKEARFKKMEQEKEQLIEKFEFSVYDVKQKTEFRALLLEKKVETLGELLKRKEGALEEMIETSDIPPEDVQELTEQVSDLLRAKNAVIDNLEYELAKATKAHNDLIYVYRAKMAAAGVPEDELDFEVRPSNTTTAPAPALFR